MDKEYDSDQEWNDSYQDAQYDEPIDIQKAPYEVLPCGKIMSELIQVVKETKQLICLPDGWSLLLLQYFKWNSDILKDRYFTDLEFYKKNVGFNINLLEKPYFSISQNKACDICGEQQITLLINICGDGACPNCWMDHLNCKLQYCGPFIQCILGCGVPVLNETIRQIANWLNNFQSYKFISKYEKKLCELFSCSNRSFQFCIGTDCSNYIKINVANITTVSCTCGKVFCFNCQSDDHSPCSCDQKKKWLEHVLKEQANAKWIAINTKICPFCKNPVQRNQGCNFMHCICDKDFCYVCAQAWAPFHTQHYKCVNQKKIINQQTNDHKKTLEHMNNCAYKFLSNQTSAIYYREKCNPFDIRKKLNKYIKVSMSDSQFLEDSFKYAAESCDQLKWVYAFQYFFHQKKSQSSELFELLLENCQIYRENLKMKLSINLQKFIKQIQKLQKINKINLEQAEQSFKKLKKQIVDYQALTKKNHQIFIQSLQKWKREYQQNQFTKDQILFKKLTNDQFSLAQKTKKSQNIRKKK